MAGESHGCRGTSLHILGGDLLMKVSFVDSNKLSHLSEFSESFFGEFFFVFFFWDVDQSPHFKSLY